MFSEIQAGNLQISDQSVALAFASENEILLNHPFLTVLSKIPSKRAEYVLFCLLSVDNNRELSTLKFYSNHHFM